MAAGRWEYLRLAFLGKPRSDRNLYRLVKRRRVRRIVELGIGSVERAIRLIRVSQRYADGQPVAYAGLDWFEERSDELPPLKLIDAHRRLKATGAEVRLMPGGPAAGLPSVANALTDTDLLLVSPLADDVSLGPAWFFMPRMLHEQSTVLRASAAASPMDGIDWRPLTVDQVEQFAGARDAKRAA